MSFPRERVTDKPFRYVETVQGNVCECCLLSSPCRSACLPVGFLPVGLLCTLLRVKIEEFLTAQKCCCCRTTTVNRWFLVRLSARLWVERREGRTDGWTDTGLENLPSCLCSLFLAYFALDEWRRIVEVARRARRRPYTNSTPKSNTVRFEEKNIAASCS